MLRSRAINAFGAIAGRARARHRHGHQVHQGRLPRADRDADPVRCSCGPSTGTTRRCRRNWPPITRGLMLPSRNHVVVLVSKLHKPTMRALAYARATRPDTLTALTVNVDDEETRALLAEWERRDLPVKLTVLESPYREVTRPHRRLRAKPPARHGRATWSACSSPSTWSGTGGSTCCTTSRRCA